MIEFFNCLKGSGQGNAGPNARKRRRGTVETATVASEYGANVTFTAETREFFRECYPHIIEIYRINPYINPKDMFRQIRALNPGPFYKRWCNPETCILVFSSEEKGIIFEFFRLVIFFNNFAYLD